MVILIVERVTASLRGELSRWMIEPRTGVFVGAISGMVRDRLWEKVRQNAGVGAALLLHSARTEQGFQMHTHGDLSRQPIDVDGLTLVRIPQRAASTTKTKGKRAREPDVTPSQDSIK